MSRYIKSTNRVPGIHSNRKRGHAVKADRRFDKYGEPVVKETEFTRMDKLLNLPIGTGQFSEQFKKGYK